MKERIKLLHDDSIEINLDPCNGQGKITNNLALNLLAGYTYMNHFSLTPDAISSNFDLTLAFNSSDLSSKNKDCIILCPS